jgi:hemerythrin HHE cation binding domain-containing protein
VTDHDELDMVLDHLIATYRCGDRDEVARAFTELEVRLAPHLEMEERLLFPEFARVEPAETAALRTEHDAIRARIGELGVELELHHSRLSTIEELALVLRRHAAREQALLYRWADKALPRSNVEELTGHAVNVTATGYHR